MSAPLSFPARSIRENLPCILSFLRRMIWNTAWLRDEWALAEVCPDVLGRRHEGQRKHKEDFRRPLHENRVGRQKSARTPAAVAHFDELQDIFCAPDLLLLEPHHLNLLLPVLQHPQLRFAVQQIKHLPAQKHSTSHIRAYVMTLKKVIYHFLFHCRFQRR